MLGLYGCQQSLHLIFLSVYVFLPIISGLIFVLFFFCGGSSACRSSSSVAAFLSLADPLAEASTLGEVGSFLTLSFFGFATSDGLLLFSFLDFSFSFSPVAVFDFFLLLHQLFRSRRRGAMHCKSAARLKNTYL
jgi:ABC-type sulfate transport system permease subunit